MRSPFAPDRLLSLYRSARTARPDEALRALGEMVLGHPAYLACGGYAIHAMTGVPSDAADPDVHLAVERVVDDQTFAIWGLRFSQVSQPASSGCNVLIPAIVAVRLGLLMQCLDTAFLHLEGRESFGQKLLHHQLMKARFAQINAEVQRLLDELTLRRTQADIPTLLAMQRNITRQFRQAAKLMGGHGFLDGRCHALEFLATLLCAIFQPGIAASGRSAVAGVRDDRPYA